MTQFRQILAALTLRRRAANGVLALICASLMGFALYAQYGMGLEPCPLCILQRVAVIASGAVFLLAALHGPGTLGSRIYAGLALLPIGFGGVVAGRHAWLQNLPPDEVPACGPGLGYMLDVFPMSEVLRMVFTGSGECAEVVWQFLGLSMPAWVLVWFVILTVAVLLINVPRVSRQA